MRPIGMLAICMLVLCGFATSAQAESTTNTKTNDDEIMAPITIDFTEKKDLSILGNIHESSAEELLEGLTPIKTPLVQKTTEEAMEKEKTKEKEQKSKEISITHRDKTLAKWQKKQEHLWKQLHDKPFIINASAYTAATDECGKDDGITASGVKVQEKRTLACPPEYPFGAKISIEGYGIYTCEDRGGAIKGNHFDIYMETKSEAFTFGRKNIVAKVIHEDS